MYESLAIYNRLTWTHYSCISRMGAGTSSERDRFVTLSQVHLCPYTSHIAVPRWTTASPKGNNPMSPNCSQVSQLKAHNCSIRKIPVVVTYSAPLAKEKDLNTPLQWSDPSHQSDGALLFWVIQHDVFV